MTPEGKVKAGIDRLLERAKAYQHKPVQNGMGKPALDYHVCCRGLYAGIEAKAKGEKPTKRQERTMREQYAAGGSVFLIDDLEGEDYRALQCWLSAPIISYASPSALRHILLAGVSDDTARNDRPGNPEHGE